MISIFLPVKNGAGTLRRCLDSIKSQAYTDYEIIAGYAPSDDETLSILKECGVTVITSDANADEAPIFCYEVSKGNIFGIIGSDDEYLPGAFETIVSTLNPDVAEWCYAPMDIIGQNGEYMMTMGQEGITYDDMKGGMKIPGVSFFYTRKLVEEVGYLKPEYVNASDYEFAIRLFKLGYIPKYVNQKLVIYHATGHNLGMSPSSRETAERIKREYA